MDKILSKKYCIIIISIFIVALLQTIITQESIFDHFVDLIVFIGIAFLCPFIINIIFKIFIKIKKSENSNNTIFFCLHGLNLILVTVRLGIANLLHIRSWSGIFSTFIVIAGALLIFQAILYLLRYQIKKEEIKHFLLKIYFLSNKLIIKVPKYSLFGYFIGLFVIFLGLLGIETLHNFHYFIQDDNLSQFAPVMIDACKTLFQKGIFPEINPYQLTGLPTSAVSVYGLTYPITYLSYFIAQYLLNDSLCIIDIFCIIHLFIAYTTMYQTCKYLNVKPTWNILSSICYTFSGYSLIGVRSWYYMSPIIAFAPFIIIGLEYLKRNGEFKVKQNIIGMLIVAMIAYAGNVQMLLYAFAFYFIGIIILFLSKNISFIQLIKALYPLMLGGTLAIPQLYVTLDFCTLIDRIPWDFNRTTMYDFPTFIIPNYIFKILGFSDIYFDKYFGDIFYSGTLFLSVSLFIAFINIYFILLKNKKEIFIKHITKHLFLTLGLIALILSFGKECLLWSILHSLPVFNKFIQPIKMMVFVNLFLIFAGAFYLSKFKLSLKITNILIIIVTILLTFHLYNVDSALFRFEFNKLPNISIISDQIPDIKNYRIYSFAPSRSSKEYYPLSFSLNFPTYYGIQSIDSYDDRLEVLLKENRHLYSKLHNPYSILVFQSNLYECYELEYYLSLLKEENEHKSFDKKFYSYADLLPITSNYSYLQLKNLLELNIQNLTKNKYELLYQYGVKYFAFMSFKTYDNWYKVWDKENYIIKKAKQDLDNNFDTIYKYKDIVYYELPTPLPLAYITSTKQTLPIEFNTQGAKVDVRNLKYFQNITINMIYHKYYKVFADSTELKIKIDNYNRIVVDVPANTTCITLKYKSPWRKGFLLMIIGFLGLSILFFVIKHLEVINEQKNKKRIM